MLVKNNSCNLSKGVYYKASESAKPIEITMIICECDLADEADEPCWSLQT